LRCPFGCREHHRKQQSNQRSTAYYQTAAGKQKKTRLNAKRSVSRDAALPEPTAQHASPTPAAPPADRSSAPVSEKIELELEAVVLTPEVVTTSPMLPYLQMLINQLEGVQLSRKELVAYLLKAMRQHSIAYRTRSDYALLFLHQHPP